MEVTADLAEENKTATQATEMLETETADRMRLEKELKDIQVSLNVPAKAYCNSEHCKTVIHYHRG